MKTVLIKRSIEKDGLPKENAIYFTDRGQLFFNTKWNQWENSNGIEKECEFWYEEVELSKLIEDMMPTQEQLFDTVMHEHNTARGKGFIEGFEWLKSKLLTNKK